jgi:hypothetical protein
MPSEGISRLKQWLDLKQIIVAKILLLQIFTP